jgi:hypothetical protein
MFPPRVVIPLQPRQREYSDLFERSKATWLGYGGSRGGAKSHGARAIMLRRRIQYQGTWGVIVRRTYDDLWEEHITKYFRDWPFLRECYNDKHRELSLPGGGGIKFGYAQHEGEVEDQFQGKGFMDVLVDEATQFSQKDLTFMRTCVRWPNVPDGVCKLGLTMNPGQKSHDFVKRIFLKREYRDKENPEDYAFVQSRAWDNVEWCRDSLRVDGFSVSQFYAWEEKRRFKYFIERSDYGRKLDALPDALRVGHLLGDWDKYAGQFFDIFVPSVHVMRRAAELKAWYPRWLSIDWGYAHNCAVYAHVAMPDDKVHTYGELVTYNKTEDELAALIARQFGAEPIEAIYISPDANQRRNGPETIAIRLSEALEHYGMPRVTLANNARIAGWRLWYQLIKTGLWTCDPSCKVLVDTLPNASRDEDNLEDIIKVNVAGEDGYGDDSWDSVRYGLMSRLEPGQAPLEERVLARVAHLKDQTARQHFIPRILRQEQQATDDAPWSMRRPNRRMV